MNLHAIIATLLLLFLLLCAGCAGGLGPSKLPATRLDYNLAVQRSNNEEMLLNIIRIKYFEQPLFLQVGAVASSFSFGITGGGSAIIPDQRDLGQGAYATYSPSITSSYTDSPTVTYTPYQGQAYTQQALAEIDSGRFVTLYKSGFDIEFLLRVLVIRFGSINHSYNLRLGHIAEEHARFLEVVKILSDMDEKGMLDFNVVSSGKDKLPLLVMTLRFCNEGEAERLGKLIGVPLNPKKTKDGYLLTRAWLAPGREMELAEQSGGTSSLAVIPFRLRDGLRAMNVLAQGTDVPPELLASKKGFDLRQQFVDICDIRISSTRPTDAFVTIKYGDYWYYIRDNDSHSKETFQFLLNIFALLAADPPKNAPVLTLPVGGS